jgi:membrane-associated protease RseP (regulator of RpoE activity)
MNVHLGRLFAWTAGGVLAIALATQAARAQVAVPPVPAPAVPKVPSTIPAEGAVDTVREQAREKREAAREATDETRDTARDARRDAREAGREVREGVRETRRETREAVQDLDNLRAADLGLWFGGRGGADGLVIADISAQGAIAKVGFQEGDRIISVNDQKVTSEAEFMTFLRADDIRDQRVKVVVFRGGREQILYIMPSVIYREAVVYDPLWRYGLVIDDRYPDRVVILRVYPRTPAYYAGLRAGDVVVGLRGQRIARAADFVSAFTEADGRTAIQVNRANRMRDLEIDASADTGVRTTLKPSIDSETRIDGRGRVERLENRPDLPSDTPTIEKPRPNDPASKPRLGSPEKPATPEKPTTTEKPTLEKPSLKPGEPAVPPPADDVPALPPAPGTSKAPPSPKP